MRLNPFILAGILLLAACNQRKNITESDDRVCVVLAHPDDETIISGTLAKLAFKGCPVSVIYVTSGDAGADDSGKGLNGTALAEEREKEAVSSLQALGITGPPLFLRYPDGYVYDQRKEIQDSLVDLLGEMEPVVVIGFGPDGITGNPDHVATGTVTDSAFDYAEQGKLLLHMAITSTRHPFFAYGISVPEEDIDLRVDVSGFLKEKKQAFVAHRTQFSGGSRMAYRLLARTLRSEAFIVARNRDADSLLVRCFDAVPGSF